MHSEVLYTIEIYRYSMKSINVNFNITGCANIEVPDNMVNDSDIWEALVEWYQTAKDGEVMDALSYGNGIELNSYYVDE